MTDSNCRHPTSQIGTLPTELIALELVPQVGLEPTRISALASKTSVATITPPGQIFGVSGRIQTYESTALQAEPLNHSGIETLDGRGGGIRTHDPLLPKQMR